MVEDTQPFSILFGEDIRSPVILVNDVAFKLPIVALVSYHCCGSVAVDMHKIIGMFDGNHLPA